MVISNKDLEKKFEKVLNNCIQGSNNKLHSKYDEKVFSSITDYVIKDKDILHNFTRREVDLKVVDALNKTIPEIKKKSSNGLIADAAETFLTNLRSEIGKYLIIFPIENLKIEQPIKMGSATFYPKGKKSNEWKRKFNNIIEHTKASQKAKKSMKKRLATHLKDNVVEKPYVVIDVRARRSNADDFALEKAEMAINILRYFEDSYGLQSSGITGFGIIPTPSSKVRLSFHYKQDGTSFSFQMKVPNIVTEQTFSRDSIQSMKRSTLFQRLVNIYKASKKSEMEERILSAVSWFGEAKIEQIPYIRFLKCIVATEILLSFSEDQHEGRITANMSERLAFLLAPKKAEVRQRLIILKKMKDLYRIRSKIVHKGSRCIDKKDLASIEEYAQLLISKLSMNDEINNSDDLAQQINLRKMQ